MCGLTRGSPGAAGATTAPAASPPPPPLRSAVGASTCARPCRCDPSPTPDAATHKQTRRHALGTCQSEHTSVGRGAHITRAARNGVACASGDPDLQGDDWSKVQGQQLDVERQCLVVQWVQCVGDDSRLLPLPAAHDDDVGVAGTVVVCGWKITGLQQSNHHPHSTYKQQLQQHPSQACCIRRVHGSAWNRSRFDHASTF